MITIVLWAMLYGGIGAALIFGIRVMLGDAIATVAAAIALAVGFLLLMQGPALSPWALGAVGAGIAGLVTIRRGR